jgi:hypothetical protein
LTFLNRTLLGGVPIPPLEVEVELNRGLSA